MDISLLLLYALNRTKNTCPKKHNIHTYDLKNFDQENFLIDLALLRWDEFLDENDANTLFEALISKINNLIDKYAPLKKMTKQEFRRMQKRWITTGIVNTIKRKDKLFNRYTKAKDPDHKNKLHEEFKTLRNRITSLIHISKK